MPLRIILWHLIPEGLGITANDLTKHMRTPPVKFIADVSWCQDWMAARAHLAFPLVNIYVDQVSWRQLKAWVDHCKDVTPDMARVESVCSCSSKCMYKGVDSTVQQQALAKPPCLIRGQDTDSKELE